MKNGSRDSLWQEIEWKMKNFRERSDGNETVERERERERENE